MRSRSSLPTPRQIAETPELVALHALVHALELATRTLVAAHPDLDGDEEHVAQHTACSENRDFDLEEDLPF